MMSARSLRVVAPLLLSAAWGVPTAGEDEAAVLAALAADEQCAASDDAQACALNALQLRAKKAEAASASTQSANTTGWGSCLVYKCGTYTKGHGCQCNDKCKHYGSCCYDYDMYCAASAPAHSQHVHAAATAQHSSGKIFGHPSHSSYPQHPGFTLMLVEDFDSPIDLDSDPIWTWSDGGLIEGQIRFTKENIKFSGGKMKIEVGASPAPTAQTCSAAEVATIKHMPKTSGEMRTKYNMFRYGRYEARIKAPSVQPGNPDINGNYVATMFVFRDGKYKHWREIDFEITGESSRAITTNVLSADNTNKWSADIAASQEVKVEFNDREDFHDYAIEWLPSSITWYIDGKQVRKYSGGHVPVPDLSGKIMMNLWLFDHRALFGGPEIQNNRYPMHSEYDWFRFYKWNGDSQYPCASMDGSCLTSDDMYLAKNNPCDGIDQVGTVYGKPACKTSCR